MISLNNYIYERLKLTKDTKLQSLNPIIDDILISLHLATLKSMKEGKELALQDKYASIKDDFIKLMELSENAAYKINNWLNKNNIKSLDDLDGPYEVIENHDYFKHEGLTSKFEYKKGLFVGNYNTTLKNVMNKKDTITLDLVNGSFKTKVLDNVVITKDTIYRYLENAGVLFWHLK